MRGFVTVTPANRVANSHFGGNGVRSRLKPELRYQDYWRGDSKGQSTQSEPGQWCQEVLRKTVSTRDCH